MTFITRFAPSPTGYLHLGNIRTAIFNWLAARRLGGFMQLRLEDTDQMRGQAHFAVAIEKDLAWLGLDWHERYRGRWTALATIGTRHNI